MASMPFMGGYRPRTEADDEQARDRDRPRRQNRSHTLIVELVGRDKRVLDVGASTGYLAEVFMERGCTVTGIEIDTVAARRAEHCEKVIVGDVETLDLCEELGEEAI